MSDSTKPITPADKDECVRLVLCPVTLREARAFVTANHRTHRAPQGGLFAIGASDGVSVRAVVIVGKPVARLANDGWTAEVVRLCSDGSRNACSLLYSAAWKVARAMGYRKLITYTLAEEGGASLRASGWHVVGETSGGKWSRGARPRVDDHPTQSKLRWEPCAVALATKARGNGNG